VFVGSLDPNVTDDHLKQVFSQYGQLVHVKIPVGKRCGFVQFAERSCGEEALRSLQGTQLGGQIVRLSCGRNPSIQQQPQPQPQPQQHQYMNMLQETMVILPPFLRLHSKDDELQKLLKQMKCSLAMALAQEDA
nr:polyadenylate-binding protein RBP45-like [Tanacetum cinerariifolium]